MTQTYYDILEVRHDACTEVIRAACRTLCAKYHPDKNPHPEATVRFKLIRDAFDVLSDPQRRARYDDQLNVMGNDRKSESHTSSHAPPHSSTHSNPPPGDVTEIPLPGGVTMKLVWCPPGTFTMGTPGATNEEAPVRVMLTSGFRLGQTVVTQAQWNAVMGWRSKPWSGMDYVKDGPNFPATYVSHGTVKADSATAYCEKLTQIERQAGRLPTGWKCVLPTEAQWEYACRAGTTTPYNFKGDELQLGASAWFDKNASDIGERYAHAVGTKLANPWGLSDMHGNVWELCHDRYVDKLPGGRDPAGPSNGSDRVSRGGSWDGSAGRCRSACRRGDGPSRRNFNLGFRICLSSD